jgi:phosphoheptose isomerase
MTTEWLARTATPAPAPAPAHDTDYAMIEEHIRSLQPVLDALSAHAPQLARWGTELATRLHGGARALAAGNGGSAAEAQHLTAELVGRFDGERRAFSAISLHAESSSVTAIGNDYGFEQVFARQVEAHARPGDVLLLLSTSGKSANLVEAARAASNARVTTWAITGPGPNPLTFACDEHIALPGPSANVQEAQLVAVHSICRAFDRRIAVLDGVS